MLDTEKIARERRELMDGFVERMNLMIDETLGAIFDFISRYSKKKIITN
jgi:hypothetical protein